MNVLRPYSYEKSHRLLMSYLEWHFWHELWIQAPTPLFKQMYHQKMMSANWKHYAECY